MTFCQLSKSSSRVKVIFWIKNFKKSSPWQKALLIRKILKFKNRKFKILCRNPGQPRHKVIKNYFFKVQAAATLIFGAWKSFRLLFPLVVSNLGCGAKSLLSSSSPSSLSHAEIPSLNNLKKTLVKLKNFSFFFCWRNWRENISLFFVLCPPPWVSETLEGSSSSSMERCIELDFEKRDLKCLPQSLEKEKNERKAFANVSLGITKSPSLV